MSGCKTESETEQEQSNTSILLPIFKFNPQTTMVDYSYSSSPERSGIVTPPLCTLASVPFGWEEEPGKPRITSSSSSNTNAIVTLTNSKSKSKSKSLQLPPRLQQLVHDEGDDDATKVHSPSSVLEGPYCISRSNTCHLPPSSRALDKGMRMKERGWFGSLRGRKGFNVKREVSRGSYVFSSNSTSSADEDYHGNKVRSVTKMQHSRSISHLFHAKPWTMICESFKQVVPWKSQKLKEVGYGALNL
ncbi:uncharacterized protein At4g00950 [Arachis duranensis]|uniref:Uncharacterized protein At4g00950 n=1 Tax=Arachis duranensis TaxID=130453 RepID=A0A6P4B7T9_ARADU|nr:uncharacterized protein At4g00950 [Arachis duranensis]